VTVFADAVRLRDLGEREGRRDREREALGLDQLADLGEGVDRAASVPAAEPHPELPRQRSRRSSRRAPGDVERGVDAVTHEPTNPLD